jgi:hypothetical protein
MTEIIKKLNSTDIKKEIWSYIGYDYQIFMTNSARAIVSFFYSVEGWKEYTDHQFEGFSDDPEKYDNPLNFKPNGINPTFNLSYRNFIIFKLFIADQRLISDKKYPILDLEVIKEWRDNPRCNTCNDRLNLEEFKLRYHHNFKCNDCYDVDSNLIANDEVVSHRCGLCTEKLNGADWIKTRERFYLRCSDCYDYYSNDGDSDDNRELDSDDEIDMEYL